MKNTITIFCLNLRFAREVAKLLAEQLEMQYFDCMDCVAFDDSPRRICDSLKMFGSRQMKGHIANIAKYSSDFQNTIVVTESSIVENKKNIKHIKEKSFCVYLRIGMKQAFEMNETEKYENSSEKKFFCISKERLGKRAEKMKESADISVSVSTKSAFKVSAEIIRAIKDFFLKKNL